MTTWLLGRHRGTEQLVPLVILKSGASYACRPWLRANKCELLVATPYNLKGTMKKMCSSFAGL